MRKPYITRPRGDGHDIVRLQRAAEKRERRRTRNAFLVLRGAFR